MSTYDLEPADLIILTAADIRAVERALSVRPEDCVDLSPLYCEDEE